MGEPTTAGTDAAGADDGEPASGPDAGNDGSDPEPGVDASSGDRAAVPSLLVWALAAFHAALLVAIVVGALIFAGVAGNQLAALDTSVGVVAYGYLWAIAWWTNRRMLESAGPGLVDGSSAPTDVVVEAMRTGGLTGLLVFFPALVVGVVFLLAATGLEAVPFLLVAGAVGTTVAAGVGVVVGAAFALLDLLLVRAALAWMPHPDVAADRSRRTAK